MGEAAALTVRPLDEHTRAWANTLLTEQWGSTRVVTRGRLVDAAHLPGFVALRGEVDDDGPMPPITLEN